MAKKQNVGALLVRALTDAERARDDLRVARGNVRRYKGKAAKGRARRAVADAERRMTNAERRVNKYADVAAKEEGGEGEGLAREWELGFSYVGNPKKKQAVMVNARIRHKSGRAISRDDVRGVIAWLHGGGDARRVPGGYKIEGVAWRRGTPENPSNVITDGEPVDLNSFSGIAQTISADSFGLRVSPVKSDDWFDV